MNYILTALMTLAPIWNIALEPIHIDTSIQRKLNLVPSVDDRYVLLTFKDTRDLLAFKSDCFMITEKMEEFDSMLIKYRDLLELKDQELEEKQREVDLHVERITLLEQAIEEAMPPPSSTWSPYAVILGTVIIGTIAYGVSR